MRRTHKPVKGCHDCGLNLGERCGVFDWPHDQWHQRICPGYRNDELARQFLDGQAKHPSDPRKIERRQSARLHSTEPHHQGARDPARR